LRLHQKGKQQNGKRVYEKGISHNQTKGQLNKWITSLYFTNRRANNIKLYGDKAYIYCDEILVTVLQIPANLMKNLKSMIKG
jgi:hypothetical protein